MPLFDPWVIMGAIAVKTTRIRFGTMITPISRRRPWKVARECVTVDQLSKGRLILEEAGATWWVEGDMGSLSLARLRERLRQGPPV